MAKAILVCFLPALLMQHAFAQCVAPVVGAGLGCGCGAVAPIASTGGSFVVTSASPIPPTGVSVVSENIYEGALVLGGNLPLLGSVGLEGEFPTAGAGAVSYGCGDDAVAIVEESPIATGILATDLGGYGLGGYGLGGYGLGGYGLSGYGYGVPFGLNFGLGRGFPFSFGRGFGFGAGPFSLGYGGYGLF